MNTDTERISAIIVLGLSIDCPEAGESDRWVIYDEEHALGDGLAADRNLRTALDKAIARKVEEQ